MSRLRELLNEAAQGSEPLFSAAVAMVSDNGRILAQEAVGRTMNYRDESGETIQGWPVAPDTLFDLASITKAFVTATLLEEFEARGWLVNGMSGLQRPLSGALKDFDCPEFAGITVLDVLTHVSGLPAEWQDNHPGEDPAEVWNRFRKTMPVRARGTVHEYSCVGFIWLSAYLRASTGMSLRDLMTERIFHPLGLESTHFRPEEPLDRIAATEVQAGRGLVHGTVHDETAFALGGISGNAGLFSTGPDLLTFVEMLRNGGQHHRQRIMSPDVVALMTHPASGPHPETYRQAVGLRVGEPWLKAMAPDSREGETPVGHGGFTGTAFGFVPDGSRSVVLLTNRVHPSRDNAEKFSEFRQAFMEASAEL